MKIASWILLLIQFFEKQLYTSQVSLLLLIFWGWFEVAISWQGFSWCSHLVSATCFLLPTSDLSGFFMLLPLEMTLAFNLNRVFTFPHCLISENWKLYLVSFFSFSPKCFTFFLQKGIFIGKNAFLSVFRRSLLFILQVFGPGYYPGFSLGYETFRRSVLRDYETFGIWRIHMATRRKGPGNVSPPPFRRYQNNWNP